MPSFEEKVIAVNQNRDFAQKLTMSKFVSQEAMKEAVDKAYAELKK